MQDIKKRKGDLDKQSGFDAAERFDDWIVDLNLFLKVNLS